MNKQSMGYIIWAPDYVTNSAGVKCLYILCDLLNQNGYSSYIAGSERTDPSLQAPLISMDEARKKVRQEGFVAVYAETALGNPLGATKVARWVLNKPGLLGGSFVYDSKEWVFTYSDVYKEHIKNSLAGKLYLPTIDQELFFNDGRPLEGRNLECFYVGKSTYKEGYFNKEVVFEITRQTPPRRELGKLFRASRVLYCFDNSSVLAYEAIMCGCPVVVIPDGSHVRSDYEKLELGMNGLAWGLGKSGEELERAKSTVHLMPAHYEQVKSDFSKQLDLFLEISQGKKVDQNGQKSVLKLGGALPKTACENCFILRDQNEILNKQLDAVYNELDAINRSKTRVISKNVDIYLPGLKKVLLPLGGGLYYGLRFFLRSYKFVMRSFSGLRFKEKNLML